jgi:hypothetical protein
MFILLTVVTVVLSVALLASAGAKLTKQPALVEGMTKVDVPIDKIWMLAVLEIAGAVGMLVGLRVMPLGLAAAIGVVLYFVGAIIFHVRANDTAIAPPAALGVVALVVAVLQVTTS